MAKRFQGFEKPKTNYFRLPHCWIDICVDYNLTKSEILVGQYVMRHTWGFNEDERRLSLDEFESGRKRRDRTRMDSGTGLSRASVIKALRSLVTKGILLVETEGDGGRIRKTYSLNLRDDDQLNKSTTPVQKVHYPRAKSPLRSEKETNKKKETQSLRSAANGKFLDSSEIKVTRNGKEVEPFFKKCAEFLAEKVLKPHGYTLGNKSARKAVEGFILLANEDEVPRKKIQEVLKWYAQYIKERYVPKAYTSQKFREKWNEILDAKDRIESENKPKMTDEERKLDEETYIVNRGPALTGREYTTEDERRQYKQDYRDGIPMRMSRERWLERIGNGKVKSSQ